MKAFVLFGIVLLVGIPRISAQNLLSVENPRALKRELYQPGDIFQFKTYGNSRWLEGYIDVVYDSSLVIRKEIIYFDGAEERREVTRDQIPFREIRYVKYNGRSRFNNFQKIYGISALGGGALLAGTVLINVATTSSNEREVDEGSLYLAGGMAASGLILLLTAKNKHRIGRRWIIRAMPPFTPDLSATTLGDKTNPAYPTQ